MIMDMSDAPQNVVELLDDLFQRAAEAPGEAPDMNFIMKHAGSMKVGVGSMVWGMVNGCLPCQRPDHLITFLPSSPRSNRITCPQAQGLDNPAARLFSNPAGDYGSMVNERVGASTWENGDELGDTWSSRNSYSYGKG